MTLEALNRLFGRVIVLTLPSRNVWQRSILQQQLAGVQVEWLEGVDASQRTIDDLRSEVIEAAGADSINPDVGAYNWACWLSHRRIWQDIASGDKTALILQDDAWFLPDADRRLNHYFDELSGEPINGQWGVLWLSQERPASALDAAVYRVPLDIPVTQCESDAQQHRQLITDRHGRTLDHVVRACRERVNLVAHAITPDAARALLQPRNMLTVDRKPWTTDWWLGRLSEPGHDWSDRCFVLTPFPVWHNGYYETLFHEVAGITMAGFADVRLAEILTRSNVPINVAAETGTFEAATARLLRSRIKTVHSVELQPARWRTCCEKYQTGGLHFHLGDSADWVQRLATAYSDQAVLWYLDAHWFAPSHGAAGAWGLPVADTSPFPLWSELDAIVSRNQPDVVIVDDVHAFGRHDLQGGGRWDTVTRDLLDARLGARLRESEIIGDQYVAFLTGAP